MKNSRRLLAFAMAIIMCISFVPSYAFAADDASFAEKLTAEEITEAQGEPATEEEFQEEDVYVDSAEGAEDTVQTQSDGLEGTEFKEQTAESNLSEEELPEDAEWEEEEYVFINPVYENILTEDDILASLSTSNSPLMLNSGADNSTTYYTTVDEAGAILRDGMVARKSSVVIYYKTDSSPTFSDLIDEIYENAVQHTGIPTEGDSLAYEYGGGDISARSSKQGSYTYYIITFSMSYYTTAAQEQEMNTAVASTLSSLQLNGKSDYQKICAIYDYICANVTYDNANLDDDSYKLKYTGYAALVNHTAVCQGYSVLFYRLCLEEGVDARVISSDTMCHAWNIVKLDDYYYELDSTWDAGVAPANYNFYLCGSDCWLKNHTYGGYSTLGDQFDDEEFAAAYPLSAMNYAYENHTKHVWNSGEVLSEATCKSTGSIKYTCTVCGATKTETIAIDSSNHSWDAGTVTKKATSTSKGVKTFTCTVCGATKTESIPVNPNVDDNGTNVKTINCGWATFSGKKYWYENGTRQGTYDDADGVMGDGTIRGREIYDPNSNGWYWLDACYDGAKAVSKEVWMPYIYQNEASWGEDEIWFNANASDSGMAQQVHDAIVNHIGKWVRYDADGKMYKGWCTINSSDEFSYCPDQVGNTYYYDSKTGLMAKGWLTIAGKTYHFDETTGVLIR